MLNTQGRRAIALTVVSLVAALPGPVTAQDSTAHAVWNRLRTLTGTWSGRETGRSGNGMGERHYDLVLADRFVHFRNRSVFPPQSANPAGEIHEDWGFFSWDAQRANVVLRQFVSEGYINQYALRPGSTRDSVVFESESLEGAPPGLRARLTLVFRDDTHFVEQFDLGDADALARFLENVWRRR